MSGSGPGEDGGPAASFVRGLTLGALLGAAVAGSSLWSRRRRARRARMAAADEDAMRMGPGAAASGPGAASSSDVASSDDLAPDAVQPAGDLRDGGPPG